MRKWIPTDSFMNIQWNSENARKKKKLKTDCVLETTIISTACSNNNLSVTFSIWLNMYIYTCVYTTHGCKRTNPTVPHINCILIIISTTMDCEKS